MNVILIGYGKMGRAVEILIKADPEMKICAVFDESNPLSENEGLTGVDAALDFSAPGAVLDNMKILASKKINCVLGTTGWYDKKEEVFALVEKAGTGLVWDSNFSVGMNLFFEIVKKSAALFEKFAGYDVCINEIHHRAKKDSPSGTALVLGNIILENDKNKKKIYTDKAQGVMEEDALHITSTRYGTIFGDHGVSFDSAEDTVELRHNAKSRDGFAKGALLAAKWIKGKKGIYRMKDVLGIKG